MKKIGSTIVLSSLMVLLTACGGGSSSGTGIGGGDDSYSYIPDEVSSQDAHALLLQSSFGPNDSSIEDIKTKGIINWIDSQLNAPSAYDSTSDSHLTYLERTIDIGKMASPTKWNHSIEEYVSAENDISFNRGVAERAVLHYHISTWFENALNGEDQLRQRVAYALSQITVVSDAEELFKRRGEAFSYYYDILAKNAFGNYRDILLEVSKSPAMGIYLTHQGNRKFDPATNRQPDENYARELMQLFSIGLSELNPDGTLKLDGSGKSIPTYTQNDIEELSRVFTGWDLALNSKYGKVSNSQGSFTQPMEFTIEHHDFGEKTVLGETVAAGNSGEEDIEAVVDILMNHPNIAPFISKHLIMRLVTSNPTPQYVARVSSVFNDNGEGVKGDLKAVVRAILLDKEARVPDAENSHYVKFKEPILAYTQLLRTFDVTYIDPWDSGSIGGENGTTMENVYLFKRDLKEPFGQAPMRAKNVFNFYSPDFIPNDSYFKDNQLVAPELEIQSAQMLTNYSNRIAYDIGKYEKMRVKYRGGYYAFYDRFIISFVDEVDLVRDQLDNDFNNIRDEEYKEKAVDALIAHLNEKITNSTLSSAQTDIIKEYLLGITYGKSDEGIRVMVANTVYAMATSNTYMVQR